MQPESRNRNLKRPLTVAMFFAGLLLFGVLSFFQVPLTLFPTSDYPGLTISVEYPGADVGTVEETLTIPIEEIISSVGGIEEIRSSAERGRSEINVEFQKGSDLDLKGLEIRERVDLVSGRFPREVHKPMIYHYDPDQKPVLILSLESDKFDFTTLRSIADNELKRYLENIEGVSKIAASGGKLREILIGCDMQKLRAYGLDLHEIQKVLQANNRSASIGSVRSEGNRFNMFLSGKYRNLREIQKQPILSKESGKTFFLEEVADISYSFRDESSSARINGKDTVSVYVYKSSVGNPLQISSDVDKTLAELKLPHVKFNIAYDQSDTVRKTYRNTAISVVFGMIALGISLLVRKKYGNFEVFSTLLVQFIVIFFLFQFLLFVFKANYDIIVLCAETIGFALWIVLYPFLSKGGKYGEEFDFEHTAGEFLSLVIIVLSLCFPLYYLDRDTGESTLRFGTFLSLYLSLCYFSFGPLHSILDLARRRFQRNYTMIPMEESDSYTSLPDFPSRFHLSRRRLIPVFLVIVILGIWRFVSVEKELFYSVENRKILGFVELPADFNFPQTDAITKEVENKILQFPGVTEVASRIEPGHSFLVITLDEGKIKSDEFINGIKKEVGGLKPAFCYFSRESESSKFKEVKIDILGDNYNRLNDLAQDLAGKASSISGVEDVILNYKAPRDELELSLNHQKISNSTLSNSEVAGFLKTAIQGSVISKFLDDNRELDIRLRALKEFRNSPQSLEKLVVKNQMGKYIPVPELSSKKESRTPTKIFRKNKKRTLSFSILSSGLSFSEIKNSVLKELGKDLPENYFIELGRNMERIVETERRLYGVLGFSFLLIFMILASYFESFFKPLPILLASLPIFFATLILASFVFGSLSLPVYLALLLTVAVVCFQSLFLVRNPKLKSAGWGRESFLAVSIFFLPQILFPREGGKFLMEFEVTILVGMACSMLGLYFVRFQSSTSNEKLSVSEIVSVVSEPILSKRKTKKKTK
ncbi:AcrB/AcrD/AcrF family protein [Leptospira fletcheri]|uniref:AcrB/AcrD/AcrF family protein n=1 Tax=Leptospira fletcheri TaxID=2484981 RepID=A0A4R9GIV1_9LEPT|nr:efflux RND transporter permease subunit [Leptospira fletcheri]TGK12907.1 AcrB/AcrD/AcrF family protein [Leptospira fletcheri]